MGVALLCRVATDQARYEVVRWLQAEVVRATTADLQRAAEFLEFARETRLGCREQRRGKRKWGGTAQTR